MTQVDTPATPAAPTTTRTTADRLVGLAAAALTGILGAFTIDSRSFWLDEAFTWGIVDQPSWGDFWSTTDVTAGNMLVYHALLRPMAAVSTDEAWLRLPSLVFAMAAVWFTHALAQRLFGRRAAWMSALLASVSVSLLYYAVEARSYAMVAFLSVLSWYLLHRGLTEDRTRHWVLFGLAVALNCSAQAVAYMSVPVLVLAAWVLKPSHWSLIDLARRLTPMGVALLVPLAITVGTPGREADFPPPLGPGPLGRAARFLTNDHGPFSRDGIGFLISGAYLAIFALALLALVRTRRRPDDAHLFVWIWLLGVPVTLTVVSIVEPVLWHRLVIAALPATHLVAGDFLASLDRRRLAVGVVAALAVASVARTAIIADAEPSAYDQVAEYLEAEGSPGDLVVFTLPFERQGVDYQFRDGTFLVGVPPFGPFVGLDDDPGTGLAEATADTIWVVGSAEGGEVWIDDEWTPDQFDFSETDAAMPEAYELVDSVFLERHQIRRYDRT